MFIPSIEINNFWIKHMTRVVFSQIKMRLMKVSLPVPRTELNPHYIRRMPTQRRHDGGVVYLKWSLFSVRSCVVVGTAFVSQLLLIVL